ncbi:hypothetical protein [Clostridium sp. KNHs214]|nr:hypothetical protein [Clostridium sp. KNHs214]
MAKKMYETHKKGKKNDGHKPEERAKGNKRTEERYENFHGEPIE